MDNPVAIAQSISLIIAGGAVLLLIWVMYFFGWKLKGMVLIVGPLALMYMACIRLDAWERGKKGLEPISATEFNIRFFSPLVVLVAPAIIFAGIMMIVLPVLGVYEAWNLLSIDLFVIAIFTLMATGGVQRAYRLCSFQKIKQNVYTLGTIVLWLGLAGLNAYWLFISYLSKISFTFVLPHVVLPKLILDWNEMAVDNGTAIALVFAGLLGLVAVVTSLTYSPIFRIPLYGMNLIFKPFGASKNPWKEAGQQVNLLKGMTYLIGGAYTGIVGFGVSRLTINFGTDAQLANLGLLGLLLFYGLYLAVKLLIPYEETLTKGEVLSPDQVVVAYSYYNKIPGTGIA